MKFIDRAKRSLQTDQNWKQANYLLRTGTKAAPSASAKYLLDKVPIVGWLPRYNPRWILNDLIAGLTLGIMLIPQGLAYAKIATIPVQYGLMASWLPGILYTFMGTSKDLSTGPTSLIGLLTAEVVADLTKEGYSAQSVASAIAMGMGVYGMILGFLKLGFLLDFVSTPVLNGFISAAAIVIGLGQVDSLLGEDNVGDGTGTIIHDVFAQLPNANGLTCAIGLSCCVILVGLDQVGKRYGNKNRIAFYFGISRAFICVLLFTGISYAVNGNKESSDDYLWQVAEVQANGLEPRMVDSTLFTKCIGRAIAPFVAAALEHTAIARAFGMRNNYVPDVSQELTYLGVVNFVNSFFSAMGVGGAMSRTSVNSGCKVRSPLCGTITTAVVLISIYELTGALYWIPKAVLAAIVITAIWPLIGTWRTYYNYWRTSFTDFVAAMLTFWLTLFVSSEVGIGTGVGWSIAVALIRQAFKRPTHVGSDSPVELQQSLLSSSSTTNTTTTTTTTTNTPNPQLPPTTRLIRLNENLFFPAAHHVSAKLLDVIQTHHSPAYSSPAATEASRTWSVVGERRVRALRKKAGITDPSSLPALRVLLLDFGRVNHMDVTGLAKLRETLGEVRNYAGEGVGVGFVGVCDSVRRRLGRARPVVKFVDYREDVRGRGLGGKELEGVVVVFRDLMEALGCVETVWRREVESESQEEGMEEKGGLVEHKETV